MHKVFFLLVILSALVSCSSDQEGRSVSFDNQRIVGGKVVREKSYRAVVAIIKNNSIHCSGVAISRKVILTAAHCLVGQDVDELSVYVGQGVKFPFPDASIKGQYEVAGYMVHPSIKYSGTGQIENLDDFDANDIALLFLEDELVDVSPFRILTDEEQIRKYVKKGEKPIVIGYGYTGEPQIIPTGKQPPSFGIKRYVKIPIVDINNHEVDLRQIGRDSCYFDSGGPALIKTGKYYQILGIVSGSNGLCAEGEFPVYYALGYASSCWIHEVTGIKMVDVASHCARANLVRSKCWHLSTKDGRKCAKAHAVRDLFGEFERLDL